MVISKQIAVFGLTGRKKLSAVETHLKTLLLRIITN